jgi:acetyltransferase
MPVYINITNPMDLAGDADSKRFKFALDRLLLDENIDSLVLTPLLQTSNLDAGIVEVVINASQQMKKPMVLVTIGGDYTENNRKIIEEGGVPTYTSLYVATKALAKLTWYAMNHYQRE